MTNALTMELLAISDGVCDLTPAERNVIHDGAMICDLVAMAHMPPRSLMVTPSAQDAWDRLHMVKDRLEDAVKAINNKEEEL